MESLQSQLKEQSRRLEQLEEISRREDDEEYVSDSGEWIDCAGCSSPIKPFWPRCPGCKEETKKSIERLAKKRQVSSPNGQNGNEAFRKMLQQELNKISDPSFLPKANGSSHAQQQGSQESFSEEEKRTSLTADPPLNGNGDKSHSHFGNGVDKLKADQCEFGTQTDSFVAHIWPDKFDEPVKTQYEEPADANNFDRLEDTTPLSCKLLFGGFTHQSMIRRKCFDVHKSPFWGSFFVLVTLANASVIAVRPSLSPDFNSAASGTSNNSTSLSEAFDFFCVAVLFCEVLSGCIAFGFYDWIHSDYHKLDFAALLVVALEYGASAYGENALILRPFRILRILRPLVKLEMFAKLAEILQSLHEGVDELATVFVLLLFFLIGFCILAMAVLSKSFRRRCVMLPHLVPVCASDFSTGWANESKCTYPQTRYTMAPGGDVVVIAGYPFQTTCDYVTNDTVGQYDGVYPLDPYRGVYHTCQLQTLRTHGPQYVTQTCADVGNPQNGFQHFDNFAGAFVSLFQYMTADSAYDVLWYSLDSEHEAGAKAIVAIMLFSVSIFCTWILVGVFVGVVTGTFARIRREKKGEEDELMSSGEEEITTNPKVVQSVQVVNEAGWRLVSRVKIEDFARAVASHRHFGNFMSCVILVHALTMAMNRYNAEDAIKNWALYGYVIYNCIYSIESFCYAIASSNFTAYIRNPFYFFEFALVMLMWLAIFLGNDALLLVGAIRLYRLMRYFPTLYDLLYAALAATPSLAHLVVFICLVGLAFCVTGRYVFRDKMDALTRSNFGTFYISVLTSFQIFTGDSWSGILYSAMSSKDTTLGVVFGCLLIMAWFIFAQLIISNLFIAIIIENFEVGRTIANIEKPGITSKSLDVVRSYYTNFFNSLEPSRIVPSTSPVVEVQLEAPQPVLTTRKSMFMNTETASTSNMGGLVMEKVKKLPQEEEVVEVEPGRILYCLEPGHPIRRLFAALETSIYFDYLILLCIIGSCIILTITPPAEDIPDLNVPLTPQQINSANLIFTLVFTIELVMRVMSKGLVFTNNAYLRDGWNVVDFTILFFAWLEVSGMLNGQPSLSKQARLFRALRPIRILKRSAAMKKIINALICTIIPALYVVAFQFFNLVVFGLIGMGLFGGKFYRCLPGGADYPAGIVECSGLSVSESDGLLRQRVWWKPGYSFDTFYDSMITLYRVGTFKYVSVIQDGMDVTALDQSPNFLHSSSYGLFFVAYLLVGGLFVMNLFVGFIVDGFNYSRGASEVEVIHARYTRMLGSYGPKFSKFSLPTSKLSIRIRALVESASFQTFSVVCVTANVIFMLTEDSEASPRYKNVLFVQNTFFFLELGAEVLLYSIGYGVGTFIDDQWRAFDLFVFLGTLAGYAGNSPKVTQFAKSFRLTRLIRLMARVKAIRIILETMLACIPRAFSILFLLFIVYSMFALFAVASFGTTRYGIRIGPTANFETYARSIVTSYQLVTGDEWQDMMYDLRVQPPSCTKLFTADVHGMSDYNYSFGDCGSSFSDLYFVVFQIICQCMVRMACGRGGGGGGRGGTEVGTGREEVVDAFISAIESLCRNDFRELQLHHRRGRSEAGRRLEQGSDSGAAGGDRTKFPATLEEMHQHSAAPPLLLPVSDQRPDRVPPARQGCGQALS